MEPRRSEFIYLRGGGTVPVDFFLPRKARKRVSPDTEAITKRDLRANQSYLRHFPSGRKVIGETRRENFVNHFPDQKTFRVFRGKHPRAREDPLERGN